MKTRNGFALAFVCGGIVLIVGVELRARADGIPEPGLVMYGVVRNAASGNARLVSGTITWTIMPASGSPINLTTALTNIENQYSYLLRVPFESMVGNATLSHNVLQLNTAPTTCFCTNVTLTIGTNNYPATITASVPFAPPLVTT